MSKTKKPNKFIVDPYSHFYEIYKDEEQLEAKIEEYQSVDADPEFLKATFDQQISEAKVNKKKWVYQAMQHDPAFLVDPRKEYYEKLLPEQIKTRFNDNQLDEVLSIYDPVLWAEKNLLQRHGGWKGRTSRKGIPYQAQMIRCRSKRIAFRAGRRIGKTLSMAVRIIHRAFTWYSTTSPAFNIVLFTPNQSQIDLIFKMVELLIDGNPKLMEMVVGNKIPTRKSPHDMLELTNGVTIKGFVSGSDAIRGQPADILILDEASYLDSYDIDSVIALLAENNNVELVVSSTPKGMKDYFYDRCFDPDFVSFYFPTDRFHPNWSYEMEQTFRSQLTDAGYRHEVLADFSADGEGVFQSQFVELAIEEYAYITQQVAAGWVYGVGVDWNDTQNGTQIYVLGFDTTRQKYRIVDQASISVEGWTQTMAVRKIRELNRKWRCSFIYVDYGHGAGQIENIHEMGLKAQPNSVDKMLLKAKAINFSSMVEIRDPWTKQVVKKPGKPYMVNNAVRVFENGLIEISDEDEILIKQLHGYAIDHVTPKGLPVYVGDPKLGDHRLDALILALFGFHMEYSSLGKPHIQDAIRFIENKEFGHIAGKTNKPKLSPQDQALQRDKEREREIWLNSHATSSLKPNPENGTVQRRQSVPIRIIRRKPLNNTNFRKQI